MHDVFFGPKHPKPKPQAPKKPSRRFLHLPVRADFLAVPSGAVVGVVVVVVVVAAVAAVVVVVVAAAAVVVVVVVVPSETTTML